MSKLALRKHFYGIRERISPFYRHEAAQFAAAKLSVQMCFQHSQHIACYLPFRSEFDTAPIIEMLFQHQKNCYLPVLNVADRSLYFVHYGEGDALDKNRFEILEPIDHTQKILPQTLDLILMPLIAFDKHGNRLGTGGGYYDRTLVDLRDSTKPLLIGLGYAAQEAEHLPVDPWDIALDGILTEKEFRQY